MAPIRNLLMDRAEMVDAAYLAEDHSPTILGITGTFCCLSLVMVSLRIYVRAFVLRSLGKDDWTMVATMALGIAVWICMFGEAEYGALGRHYQAITTEMLENQMKWSFGHGLFSLFGCAAVKISICFLLARVSVERSYRRFLYFTICELVTINRSMDHADRD